MVQSAETCSLQSEDSNFTFPGTRECDWWLVISCRCWIRDGPEQMFPKREKLWGSQWPPLGHKAYLSILRVHLPFFVQLTSVLICFFNIPSCLCKGTCVFMVVGSISPQVCFPQWRKCWILFRVLILPTQFCGRIVRMLLVHSIRCWLHCSPWYRPKRLTGR